MRGATREFWNSQFQMAAFLPDADAWPPRYASLSAEARTRFGEPERIATGPDPMQALWRLATGRPGHAVVFIHGGYWRRFGAADFFFAAEAAAAADATFYSVDYRLMPGVRMADLVADCLAAVNLAMDGTERAVVVGHSAGGHLAVEMALRCTSPPAAVVPISGIFSLDPLRASFLQDEIALTAGEAAAYSPQDRAASVPCPVDLFVGADETAEFHRQSARLHDALAEAGSPVSYATVPGRHHNAVVAELADPKSALCRRIADRLNEPRQ